MSILQDLWRPAHGGALGVIVVVAAGLWIFSLAPLPALPLALILISWFFKYMFILFDGVVRGVEEAPALDIAQLNPLGEQRPLALLAILAAPAAAVAALAGTSHTALAWLLTALAVVALPAWVAILGLEGSPLKALSPVHLWRVAAGMGASYALVLSVLAGCALILGAAWRLGTSILAELFMLLFAILSCVSVLAGRLYARRDELGLEVWHAPERSAARARHEQLRGDEYMIASAYAQARLGAHGNASKILQGWLAERGADPDAYRWLCGRLASWNDRRYPTRMTQEYLERLLSLGRNGEALDVLRERLRVDPQFRARSAASTLKLAQIAADGGAPSVARLLAGDFAVPFPQDAGAETARQLVRRLQR